jgi:hypothetical protein
MKGVAVGFVEAVFARHDDCAGSRSPRVECAFLTRVWQIVGDVSKQLDCGGGGSSRVVYETTIVVRVSAQGPQLAQAPPPRTLIDIVVFSGAVTLRRSLSLIAKTSLQSAPRLSRSIQRASRSIGKLPIFFLIKLHHHHM